MILHLLRALFVLLMAAVGFFFVFDNPKEVDNIDVVVWILPAVALAVLLVCIDILAPRRKLAIFSGTILGMVVGLLIAYVLSFVVTLLVTQYVTGDQERIRCEVDTARRFACPGGSEDLMASPPAVRSTDELRTTCGPSAD